MFFLGMNTIGLIILAIIYSNISSSSVEKFVDQKLFKCLVLSIMIFFISETVMCFLEGKTSPFAIITYNITTTIYFIFCTIPELCWLMYCDFKMNNDKKALLKRLPWYSIPSAVNTILVLIPSPDLLFAIDSGGVYHRGFMAWTVWVFSWIYIGVIYAVILKAIKQKNLSMPKEMYLSFFIFPIPPFICSIIQIFYPGSSLIGIGFLLSVFIAFINVQNRRLYFDEMTGAYNRRYLEVQIHQSVSSVLNKKILFIIIIDIIDLKKINVTYGNATGDTVLKKLYGILKTVFEKKDVIARISGDEYAVFGQCCDPDDVKKRIREIESRIMEYNKSHDVSFSVGVGNAVYGESEADTADAFLNRAYDRMVESKRQYKRAAELQAEHERILNEAAKGLYDNIYEADITHNRAYGENTKQFFNSIGIPAGMPFDQAIKIVAQIQVDEEHRQGYLDLLSTDRVLQRFKDGQDKLSYDCLITYDGENYHWVRITGHIFVWEHDGSIHMFTFRQNIDKEKERELAPLVKAHRLEKELAQSRISIMLSQIKPHFIFNTLNSISTLCMIDPLNADKAIMQFSEYLRENIKALDSIEPVRFTDELKHCRTYADIEKMRFGDRLCIQYNIVYDEFVLPALTIQPILENAIKHGIGRKPDGGIVKITTVRAERYAVITVSDNGVGFVCDSFHSQSVGLKNVKNRLEYAGGSMEIRSKPGEGTEVIIWLPIKR